MIYPAIDQTTDQGWAGGYEGHIWANLFLTYVSLREGNGPGNSRHDLLRGHDSREVQLLRNCLYCGCHDLFEELI